MIAERALALGKEYDDAELERTASGLLSFVCAKLGDAERALEMREQVLRAAHLLAPPACRKRGGRGAGDTGSAAAAAAYAGSRGRVQRRVPPVPQANPPPPALPSCACGGGAPV